MFSSLKSVPLYTKIIVIIPDGAWSCESREISDTEWTFLIFKAIQQKHSSGSVLYKKCSQKFRKTDRKKPAWDKDTNVFLSISRNFQEHLFYWTPPVAASSNFKASGFTEAVMQLFTILVISALLVLVGIFVFIFWQAQGFRCTSAASLTFARTQFFWQRRIEVSWYFNYPISFCANLYRNNHRITSILLSLGSIGLEKVEI